MVYNPKSLDAFKFELADIRYEIIRGCSINKLNTHPSQCSSILVHYNDHSRLLKYFWRIVFTRQVIQDGVFQNVLITNGA